MRKITCAAFLLFFGLSLSAQNGGGVISQAGNTGFLWMGSGGSMGGTVCGGFTCVPHNVTASAGEIITVQIRGDFGAPAFILAAPTAPNCFTFDNVFNEFMLDFSFGLLFSTDLFELDTTPGCPGGLKTLVAIFPGPGVLGSSFALQTLTIAGGATSLTPTIVVTAN